MHLFRAFALLTTVALLTSPAAASAADTLPRTEVEGIVKDYLLKNPEVIMEAVGNYQKKQMAEAKKKSEETLAKRADELFNDKISPALGDASKADVTLVEFFDYHCGYCKRLLPVMNQLVKEDPKLRIIFRELPILSEDSKLASKAALAFHSVMPAKYFDYHTALMEMKGKYTEENLTQKAVALGVDEAKFKAALKDPAIEKQLDKNRDLAVALNITGTPALVLKNEVIAGAAPLEEIKTAIKNQREGKKPASAETAK